MKRVLVTLALLLHSGVAQGGLLQVLSRKVGVPLLHKPLRDMADQELSAELRRQSEYMSELSEEISIRIREKERLRQDLFRIEEAYAVGE